MSNDIIIQAEELGKRYRLGELAPHQLLRKSIRQWIVSPARRAFCRAESGSPAVAAEDRQAKEHIWALKDVSFEVKRGEVLGIIGRNGAGKSTLLKILTRITKPTTGRAKIRGRVGGLLEVGTGFHPELTGRENVYLNGAILGMTRAEIRRKFDEIVEFSGVERFLDTPIKRYSSGMHVRLAFAVAAHLDPEILLIDEVLAVGDVEFQNKCVGKVGEVAGNGRTVLFVSHNMTAVQHLCTRAMVLEDGGIAFSGSTENAIARYVARNKDRVSMDLPARRDRTGSGALRFVDYQIQDGEGNVLTAVHAGTTVVIKLFFECSEQVRNATAGLAVMAPDGTRLASLGAALLGKTFSDIPKHGAFVFRIDSFPFNVGDYSILIDASSHGIQLDRVENAFELRVVGNSFYPSGKAPARANRFLVNFSFALE